MVSLLLSCAAEKSIEVHDRYYKYIVKVMYEDSRWVCRDYGDLSTCGYEDYDRERCRVVGIGYDLPAIPPENNCAMWWGDWVEHEVHYLVNVRYSEGGGDAALRMGAEYWNTLAPGFVGKVDVRMGTITGIKEVKREGQ